MSRTYRNTFHNRFFTTSYRCVSCRTYISRLGDTCLNCEAIVCRTCLRTQRHNHNEFSGLD